MHVNIKEKTIMFSETTRVEGEEQEHFTQLEQQNQSSASRKIVFTKKLI